LAVADAMPVDPSVVDLAVLEEWMDSKGLGSGPISGAVPLPGGTQNLLLQFERAGEAYVLRRPPVHKRANSDETMRRESRVLAALDGYEVPHPELIAAEPDESIIGAAFYLMESVEGFIAGSGLPALHAGDPDVRHRMGMSFVDAAAALGVIDHQAVGLTDFGRPDGYLERQVPRWRSQLDSFSELSGYPGPDIPHLDEVGSWLERNRPASFQPGLIHGDYHLGNVMFCNDSPNVAAVVDWELATVGDPLVDLGLIIAMWPEPGAATGLIAVEPWDGFPTIAELIERYRSRSTRDLSMIEWYGVLACYKTGIILEGTHARAMAGRAPTEIGDLLHSVTVGLFERASSIIAGVG